jgi:fibrillarin-like pre-rRNA processing protein
MEIETKDPVMEIETKDPVVEMKDPVMEIETKDPVVEMKDPVVEMKDPVMEIETKDPVEIETKDPVMEIETKDPVMEIETKDPVVEMKDPVMEIETKDPVVEMKDPVMEIETKDPVMEIETKDQVVEMKDPVMEIETKDPVVEMKDPMVEMKDPVMEIETKDPVVEMKDPVMEIETKDPVVEMKDPVMEIETKDLIQRERSLEEDNQSYFWIKYEGEQKISTENFVPGNQVYKEKLIIKKGIEYRLWDPFRSKLAASIMNGLENFPFKNKTTVLYLGASTGTTVSHVSDIVGPNGLVFAVEHASRVARDFLDRVATHRANVMPILQDARKPKEYFSVFGKVDVVYVDIAQPDQTKIAIDNCDMFLKKEGFFFLVIKTRSIDVTKAPKRIVEEEIQKLREKFDILESIDLHPYDKDHAMVIAKYKN